MAGCVVLRASGAEVSPAIRAWLDARGDDELVVEHPLQAMAGLFLIERGQASRAAWGLERIERLSLAIDMDAIATDRAVEQLCAAVQRRLPAVSIWALEQGSMRLIHGEEPAREARPLLSEPPAAAPAVRDPSNRMSLVPADAAPRLAGGRTAVAEASVTRDEIVMLLDDRSEQDGRT
jgi:hypothetical protein